eukprot:7729579-Pyramimonas_sp.AAC.1
MKTTSGPNLAGACLENDDRAPSREPKPDDSPIGVSVWGSCPPPICAPLARFQSGCSTNASAPA